MTTNQERAILRRKDRIVYDLDIRRSRILSACILLLCLVVTGLNVWEHHWIYAFSSAAWVAAAIATRRAYKIQQQTRDDSRRFFGHLLNQPLNHNH
jgi:hypothetical protein